MSHNMMSEQPEKVVSIPHMYATIRKRITIGAPLRCAIYFFIMIGVLVLSRAKVFSMNGLSSIFCSVIMALIILVISVLLEIAFNLLEHLAGTFELRKLCIQKVQFYKEHLIVYTNWTSDEEVFYEDIRYKDIQSIVFHVPSRKLYIKGYVKAKKFSGFIRKFFPNHFTENTIILSVDKDKHLKVLVDEFKSHVGEVMIYHET